MAKITKESAQKRVVTGAFFSLKDDADKAIVRFPYAKVDELLAEYYCVHDVSDDPKKPKFVDCLRGDDDPVSVCPLCMEGYKDRVILLIQTYNVKENKMQIWQRTPNFEKTLKKALKAYRKDDLFSIVFEIERFGKAGDTKTEYGIDEYVPTDKELDEGKYDFSCDVELEDLPELIDVFKERILIKLTEDEMSDFIDVGELPEGNDRKSDRPSRRKTSRSSDRRKELKRSSRRDEDDSDEDDEKKVRKRKNREVDNEEEEQQSSRRTRRRRDEEESKEVDDEDPDSEEETQTEEEERRPAKKKSKADRF